MAARRGAIRRWAWKFFGLEGADNWLLLAAGGLLVFGLVMLISASSVVAYKDFHDSLYYFKRQLIAVAAGLILFFAAANWPKERLKKQSWWFLLFNIALLFVVLFFKFVLHEERNGAGAWIPFFGFNIQPSEWVKPAFIMYLAARLSDHGFAEERQRIIPFIVVYLLIAGLILLQPDMGTLIIITFAGMLVLFLANIPLRQLAAITGIGLLAFMALVSFSSHQRERFRCLLDTQYSPQDKCYQLEQSLIAIGSGGVLGRGLGESRQKFLYLPEVQNDFIYAVIAEETGLLIAVALIAVYAFIFYRAYVIAKRSHDPFIQLLAMGIGGWLFFQAALNIGGVVRLLPMTGVPLPLISYGGSAMLASLAGIGLLVNLSKK